MNEIIFTATNDVGAPVAFLRYDIARDGGDGSKYIEFALTDTEVLLSSSDNIDQYIEYYDFDVYSKNSYFQIIENLTTRLIANGFDRCLDRDSGDLYDEETGYYHKTVCFCIIKTNIRR